MKHLAAAIAVASLALAMPAAALAQSSIEGYTPPGTPILPNVEENPDAGGDNSGVGGGGATAAGGDPSGTVASNDDVSSLPFTGMDLGLLAIAAGVLLVAGFGMRRLTHASETA